MTASGRVSLRTLLLVAVWVASVGARRLVQQPPSEDDPLSSVVQQESVALYQKWQGAPNSTLYVIRTDGVARFSGVEFVPFTIAAQQAIVQAFRETLLITQGPIEITAYRDYYPDPGSPTRESPGVEIAFVSSWVVNRTSSGKLLVNASWEDTGQKGFYNVLAWGRRAMVLGNWTGFPTVAAVNFNTAYRSGGFVLHPLIAMDVALGVDLASAQGAGSLSAEQASAVGQALQAALLNGGIGTLVEVVGRGQVTGGGIAQAQAELHLEVTLYVCRDGATVETPECEQQILRVVLARLAQSQEAQQQWLAVGIQGLKVLGITQRLPAGSSNAYATAISNSSGGGNSSSAGAVAAQPQPWVPWHLDRIDQRALPLDGKFTASASGTNVNVYIISSGVHGDHEEFGYLDGTPGSRVRPAWGFSGLNPSEDCDDHWVWHGYGTMMASLCCGRQLGAAKNATIYSVRFRKTCLSEPSIFAAGALPSAMDAVLSTFQPPAVVLIDTWWGPSRSTEDEVGTERIMSGLNDRLELFGKYNITVIAAAGPGLAYAAPCDNVIAAHPAVIRVAASDIYDQATYQGPYNSSCIDVFAPSGGLGVGLVGASPAGNSSYTRVVNRAFGAAAVVTGVAAQYLQQHPNATSGEVKRALVQQLGTLEAVAGTGSTAPNVLLYTNISQQDVIGPSEPPAMAMSDAGGDGLGAAAIVGISVACFAVLAATVWAIFALRMKRSAVNSTSDGQLAQMSTGPANWEVGASDIEICRQPDGSEWLLGEGRYGQVYKAIKGGVQVVAVKQLHHIDERQRALFIKEVHMMRYVSRDANITQFYGACLQGDNMMLIAEYMEGGDLREALSGDQAAELQWYRRGKDVMLDVVRGVHFLHANHVVHRDIKSKNILLGRDGRAKLADVGLAQLLADGQDLPSTSEKSSKSSSTFAGTLAWAAPEVLLGRGISEKTDIYSLGVVLWELVTLEIPQRGCLRNPEVPQQCPQGVADAIQACMQQEPAKRPTAKRLYSMLLACLAGGDGTSAAALPSNEHSDAELVSTESKEMASSGSKEMASAGASKELSSAGEGSSCGSRGKPVAANLIDASKSLISNHSGESRISLLPLDVALISIDFAQLTFCKCEDGGNQELGSGSFGSVYKVLLDGVQLLAAKCVDLGKEQQVHSAFMQEAGMLWRLRHKNVVSLSGVSIHENKGYLLMELMEGGSLFRMLSVHSKATKTRVFAWYNRGKQIALDIARGIHYLHSLRITHFDIKSGNILLTRELTAKLSDVGLARVMSSTHHSLSFDGSVGTFAYMAPELMAGCKCNQSVDIYSFGVLLWEIASGMHPVRGRMEPLRVPEDWPQAVADLHLQCTAFDPTLRPTAREVVEQLLLVEDQSQLEQRVAQAAGASNASQPQQLEVLPAQQPRLLGPGLRLGNLQQMVSPFESVNQPA